MSSSGKIVLEAAADELRRLRLRAISTFEYLTEQETAQGFAALDAAVAAEPGADHGR